MRLLPGEKPLPQLLESAAVPAWSPPDWQGAVTQTDRPIGKRFLRLLYRMVAAVLMFSIIVCWETRRSSRPDERVPLRKLISVATHRLSRDSDATLPPTPIVVQLSAELVQVTSIALGHPRLAVVNGKQIAEGDNIVVHTPARSVAITLRVVEISGRQVKLSDGTQVITVHLARSGQNRRETAALTLSGVPLLFN